MKTFTFLKVLLAGAVLVGIVFANISGADSLIPGYPDRVEAHDPREVAMLPSYCKHTQLFRDTVPGGNNADEIKRLRESIGPVFEAMHHYCWGIMKTNRAMLLAKTQQVKIFYLGDAIKEFDYVLRSARPDFVLLPELHTKKGENLIRLGRGPVAVTELERAIAIKPDYWPPYATLSDYYKATGNVTKARELLEKALSFAPEVQGLRNRLAELDRAKSKHKP